MEYKTELLLKFETPIPEFYYDYLFYYKPDEPNYPLLDLTDEVGFLIPFN